MKKLIQFNYRYDFGHDWYVQVLNIRRWSLLQVSFSWNDYAGCPYLQINMGSNGLLCVLFWAYKLGFDVSILSRTWKWDYLKDCNETTT
tara:strand:+ start:164 stop:430 length:267 start_codon:yes stop_codon:yes gene_type:complete